ncbi:MAG TPA: branched-chain amino acid ABC transporter permease [Mycobacteriales bacterium]|nr:branched-chain amino acid ABC transporter permease [Mycobacteriales bacterium]
MTTPAATRDPGSAWARYRDNKDLQRLGICLIVGGVVALMTGKSGTVTAPTSGITGTFKSSAAYVWIGIFVALWLVLTIRDRYLQSVQSATRVLATNRDRVLAVTPVKWAIYAAGLAIAIALPHLVNNFWQEVLVGQIAPYVLLAVGLNVVVGFAGLLDLGYIAFYAVGAYSAAYWTGSLPAHPPFTVNPFWAFPLAIATAMLAGVILGAPTLRLRGDYLAIVTLGFGEIIQIVANNLTSVTGGAQGITKAVPSFSVHVGGLHYAWPLELLPGNHFRWYYLILGLIVIVLVAFHLLENSRVGRAWMAIREDEVAAEAVGINPLKYKVLAFAIGASTSGVAGVFFASKNGTFTPPDFAFQASILILVLVIFGGMGSLPGAVIGAAVLQWLPQALRSHIEQQDLYIYYGALLIVMMIFRPQGLIPSRRRAREIRMAEHGVGSADAMAAPGAAP